MARSRDCGLVDGRVIMNGILNGPTSFARPNNYS